MSFLTRMADAFVEIFKSPFQNKSALWLLIPLFIIWFLLTIYFGIYKTEVLGWNSSLTNGISMFWVFVSLLAYLFNAGTLNLTKLIPLFILISYVIFIVIVSFNHSLPETLAFVLFSPTILFFLSWVAVVWVYGSLEITGPVIVDLIILLTLFLAGVEGLKYLRAKLVKDGGKERHLAERSKKRAVTS